MYNEIALDPNQDVLSSLDKLTIPIYALYSFDHTFYVTGISKYFLLKKNHIYREIMSKIKHCLLESDKAIITCYIDVFKISIVLLLNPGYYKIIVVEGCDSPSIFCPIVITNNSGGDVEIENLITESSVIIEQRSHMFRPNNNYHINIHDINGNNQMVTCNPDSNLSISVK